MSKTARRQDDIEYVEYYLRKTIQPNSLRSPKTGNIKARQQTLDPKKNFVLFLNKQTALLREAQPKKTSIRELYSKNQHSKEVILFPNFISTPAKEIPNHNKLVSLQQNDPLIKEVMEGLEDDAPKDYFYAETPAINQKKPMTKETKNELSVDKKIKFAILDRIDEKEMRDYYKKFEDQTAMEKLRDFRKDRITKNFPMATFYTSLPEQEDEAFKTEKLATEKEKIHMLLGHYSTLNTYIKQKLESTTDRREIKVIENLCERFALNTERLLMIDRNVGNEQIHHTGKSEENLDDLFEDDIEKAREEIAQRAREYEDYKHRTRTMINTFYKLESRLNTIGDKMAIHKIRSINWDFIKGKGPESFKRKKAIQKELKHLQDQRFEMIDILRGLGNERNRGLIEDEYEIPSIDIQKLDRNLDRIGMLYNEFMSSDKGSTSRATHTRENSTVTSPRTLTSPRTVVNSPRNVTTTLSSPRGQKQHRRFFSSDLALNSPQSPHSMARSSAASINSGSMTNLKQGFKSRNYIEIDVPKFVKSPSNKTLENSGQVSTKAYDSKYFSFRQGSQKNSEVKEVIDNWNDFCEKIKKISDIQKMDSEYLHDKLPKFSAHVHKIYDKIEEQQLHEHEVENKEFSSFKDEKRFKNMLIDCMMSKIKNKHAFVNVLENRNREKRENEEVEEILAYDFDIKPPSGLNMKSPNGLQKKHGRTPSLPNV